MADEQKEMTRLQVLREFFYRPGVDTLQTFTAELKGLTNEDRNELAELVAKQLNVRIKAE